MCSGTPRPLPRSSMSWGMETRARGRSAGSAPLRSIRSMASLRLTAALTEFSVFQSTPQGTVLVGGGFGRIWG